LACYILAINNRLEDRKSMAATVTINNNIERIGRLDSASVSEFDGLMMMSSVPRKQLTKEEELLHFINKFRFKTQ
jgi:hypothetical protein